MFISAPTTPQPRTIRMTFPNRKRILLVEDDEYAKDLCALTLEEYELICAHDFDEGLRLSQQRDFDLFILDSWLPDRSGVELCRAIREFDSDTPILFYSAAAYPHDKREAMYTGAQAYLTKPAAPDDLKRVVGQLISIARPKTS